ncbi:hypothetical protein LTR17_015716 [Elasticomyces elasticus]|nr:hypothetical protein LTR17_015716 [Elasticomyces elasticus]
MADHLAATYLDHAHDAERTILQLKLELATAHANTKQVKDDFTEEKSALEQAVDKLEFESGCAAGHIQELDKEIAESKEKHNAVTVAMGKKFEEENDKLKAENSELKKKLHQVEAERGATTDMYDELREKVEELENAAAPMSATTVQEESDKVTRKEFVASTRQASARGSRQSAWAIRGAGAGWAGRVLDH